MLTNAIAQHEKHVQGAKEQAAAEQKAAEQAEQKANEAAAEVAPADEAGAAKFFAPAKAPKAEAAVQVYQWQCPISPQAASCALSLPTTSLTQPLPSPNRFPLSGGARRHELSYPRPHQRRRRVRTLGVWRAGDPSPSAPCHIRHTHVPLCSHAAFPSRLTRRL